MNKNFVFRKLSPELEEVLMTELHTLKGGAGGDSDPTYDGVDLYDHITVTATRPEEEEEGETPDPVDPQDPEDDDDDNDDDDDDEENPWDDEGWDNDHENDDDQNNNTEGPCGPVALAANNYTSNLIKDTHVQSQMGNLSTITPQSPEQGFSILKLANGTLQPTPVQTLGPTGGNIINYGNSVADVHTHTDGNAPSARDIINLGYINGISANFTTRFIKTADGDQYALNANDSVKLAHFYSTFKDDVRSDNMFGSQTTFGDRFETVRQSFIASGAIPESAYDHATAALLNDAGITLLKAPSGSNDFTKIGAEIKIDANGQPVLDQNNNPTYESADCPRN